MSDVNDILRQNTAEHILIMEKLTRCENSAVNLTEEVKELTEDVEIIQRHREDVGRKIQRQLYDLHDKVDSLRETQRRVKILLVSLLGLLAVSNPSVLPMILKLVV